MPGKASCPAFTKNASFSFGGFHFTSDGYRKNNDQKDDIANAFVQLELSPATSIQGEYRYRNTLHGDLNLRFFPENFFPGERNSEERNSYRLGARHNFAPNSTLLGLFTYQEATFGLNDQQPVEPGLNLINLRAPNKALGGEMQHLFRSEFINLTSGVGYVNINGNINATTGLDLPLPPDGPGPITLQSTIGTDVSHVNTYAYSYIHPLKGVMFTLGGSGDFIKSDSQGINKTDQINQFNPKFGITWEPITGTVLRAAAFRTMKRTLISNQTLEPTQVAGFNQFFDDINGTDAWHYGGAIDQQFSKDIYSGVEFTKRDMNVPYLDFSDPETPANRKVDWEEYLGRAYAFWTPMNGWR